MSQLAKHIVDITTGEEPSDDEQEPPDPKAQKRGRARVDALTPERRSEIARKAARARWNKDEQKSNGRPAETGRPCLKCH